MATINVFIKILRLNKMRVIFLFVFTTIFSIFNELKSASSISKCVGLSSNNAIKLRIGKRLINSPCCSEPPARGKTLTIHSCRPKTSGMMAGNQVISVDLGEDSHYSGSSYFVMPSSIAAYAIQKLTIRGGATKNSG